MWCEFIETAKECQRLDYVWRYSTIPISVPESVSTHSYWVAMYSAMIHQLCDPKDTQTLAACVMHALTHDAPEGQVGDFVRTFKYRTKELKAAIDDAEKLIVDEFGPSLKALLEVSELLTTVCGKREYVKAVVKAADFMSLHNFMVREFMRGNREIIPFFRKMVRDLREMEKTNREVVYPTQGERGHFVPSDFYKHLAENALRVLGEQE